MPCWNTDILYGNVYTVESIDAPNKGFTNNIRRSDLSDGSTSNVNFTHIFDNNHVGLNATLRIIWFVSNSNTGNVFFRVSAKFLNIGGDSSVPFVFANVLEPAPGSPNTIVSTDLSVPGNLIPAGGIMPIQLQRFGGSFFDTFSGVVRLVGISIIENKLPKQT